MNMIPGPYLKKNTIFDSKILSLFWSIMTAQFYSRLTKIDTENRIIKRILIFSFTCEIKNLDFTL